METIGDLLLLEYPNGDLELYGENGRVLIPSGFRGKVATRMNQRENTPRCMYCGRPSKLLECKNCEKKRQREIESQAPQVVWTIYHNDDVVRSGKSSEFEGYQALWDEAQKRGYRRYVQQFDAYMDKLGHNMLTLQITTQVPDLTPEPIRVTPVYAEMV